MWAALFASTRPPRAKSHGRSARTWPSHPMRTRSRSRTTRSHPKKFGSLPCESRSRHARRPRIGVSRRPRVTRTAHREGSWRRTADLEPGFHASCRTRAPLSALRAAALFRHRFPSLACADPRCDLRVRWLRVRVSPRSPAAHSSHRTGDATTTIAGIEQIRPTLAPSTRKHVADKPVQQVRPTQARPTFAPSPSRRRPGRATAWAWPGHFGGTPFPANSATSCWPRS